MLKDGSCYMHMLNILLPLRKDHPSAMGPYGSNCIVTIKAFRGVAAEMTPQALSNAITAYNARSDRNDNELLGSSESIYENVDTGALPSSPPLKPKKRHSFGKI